MATLAVLLLILASCTSTPLAVSPEGQNFKSLFNGKNLAGWSVKCKSADEGKNFWRADNGAILADTIGHQGHDYVWLATDREFGDFVLRLKFQAYRDSPGNSGIQFRSRYDESAQYLDGPQIDINPPGPWRTGMIWDETRENLRWIYPDLPKDKWVDEAMANPDLVFYYSDEGPGWNDMLITAAGGKVTVVLNGVPVTTYDGTGVLDDAVHRDRNVGTKGCIALQIHKNDQLKIRFRDIVIKDLSD
jgi:hypothetical protein